MLRLGLLLAACAATSVPAAVHATTAVAGGAAAPPVEVTLYAEALCPYCAAFTTNVLWPLVNNGFGPLMHFRYVAWGNALNNTHGVKCQHGPAECRLNRVINCAIEQTGGRQADWLPFVVCLEGTDREGMEDAVVPCAQKTGLDVEALHECAQGPLGDRLERAAAEETAALQPPHQYVPWVVVNGIPLGDSFDDLWRYVCVAYTGERPEACYTPPTSLAAARLASGGGVGEGGVCPLQLLGAGEQRLGVSTS